MGRGRKDAYTTKIEPNMKIIESLCQVLSDKQIAQRLGVSYSTFNKYKKEKKEFSELLKRGRENLVVTLKNKLIEKAMGYSYEEKKVNREYVEYPPKLYEKLKAAGFTEDELNTVQKTKVEVKIKHCTPDVAAINLLLKNYDKENWSNDPQLIELRRKEMKLKEQQAKNNEW